MAGPQFLDSAIAWVRDRQEKDHARVVDVRVGAFWTIVETTDGAGMASSHFPASPSDVDVPVSAAGCLTGRTGMDLTALCHSPSATEISIGIASLNALLAAQLDGVTTGNARDLLLERARGRRLAMIGRFPFVDRLRPVCEEVWVFERGRRRADEFGQDDLEAILPQAEVVAVSATTLINHTLETILHWIRPETFLMMLGPSTPLCPVLFDLGFDVLCGTLVSEPESVKLSISEGAVTQQIKGVKRVCLWA